MKDFLGNNRAHVLAYYLFVIIYLYWLLTIVEWGNSLSTNEWEKDIYEWWMKVFELYILPGLWVVDIDPDYILYINIYIIIVIIIINLIIIIYIYMPPLHVFPLPEGSLNALPRVLRAPETDQPHLRANASIAAPTPFNGMGGRVAWAVVVAAYSNHSTLPNLSLTYMPPLHVFPLPEGSLNALPRVLRAPETDQPHLRANASIDAPSFAPKFALNGCLLEYPLTSKSWIPLQLLLNQCCKKFEPTFCTTPKGMVQRPLSSTYLTDADPSVGYVDSQYVHKCPALYQHKNKV